MEIKKYQKIVDKHSSSDNKGLNLFSTFITGGLLGLLGNFLIDFYSYAFHISKVLSSSLMLVTFIFLACLLTGFAHSIQSAILDYKNEGPVYGFGSHVFKLAGSVILYGVVSAYVFAIIRFLFFGG